MNMMRLGLTISSTWQNSLKITLTSPHSKTLRFLRIPLIEELILDINGFVLHGHVFRSCNATVDSVKQI